MLLRLLESPKWPSMLRSPTSRRVTVVSDASKKGEFSRSRVFRPPSRLMVMETSSGGGTVAPESERCLGNAIQSGPFK